jgi:hypothetical protein
MILLALLSTFQWSVRSEPSVGNVSPVGTVAGGQKRGRFEVLGRTASLVVWEDYVSRMQQFFIYTFN